MYQLIAGLIGAGMSGGGSLSDSEQNALSLDQDAKLYEFNAMMARDAGRYNAQRQQMESNQIMGRAITDYGASGVSSESGSVLEVLRQSAINSELDRQSILRGSELQARQYDYNAQAARFGAKNTRRQAPFKAFASMFGGLSSAFGGK